MLHTVKPHVWWVALILAGLAVVLALAWRAWAPRDPGFVDRAAAQSQVVPDSAGDYGDLAWVTENQVAALYSATPVDDAVAYRIVVVDRDTGGQDVLPMPDHPDCSRPHSVAFPDRLPDTNLGFMFDCFIDGAHSTSLTAFLYEWDWQTERLHLLYRYPWSYSSAGYAYAPDMSQLVVENAVGTFTRNELHWVHPDGRMERLVPGFLRAQHPAWSPDGAVLAFSGTEGYAGRDPRTPLSMPDLIDLAHNATWGLYVLDIGQSQPRRLAPTLAATNPRWSPEGNLLAFSGLYQDTDGIFVLDLVTNQVCRVWTHGGAYDWSPDGRHMVALQSMGAPADASLQQLVIINLPITTVAGKAQLTC